MSAGHRANVLTTALLVLAAIVSPAAAQSVVSARSGVVHYFEGTVYLGDQRLEPQLGRFPMLADGDMIRTEVGRAEVLLTPGVFLRMAENSAVRMLTSDLEDTRVELVSGSAGIDCTQTAPGAALTVTFQQWEVHFLNKGIYRLNSEPAVLAVRNGSAEVRAAGQAPVTVEKGMRLPLEAVLVPERAPVEPDGAFSDWSIGRRQAILADDAIAAQIDEGPGSGNDLSTAIAGVSYFPLIGLTSVDPGYYGSPFDRYAYQPGFNSVYLPGYYSRPLILSGFGGVGYRTGVHSTVYPPGLYSPPSSGYYPPGVRVHIPRVPPVHAPAPHPAYAPPPPAPHTAVHVGRGR